METKKQKLRMKFLNALNTRLIKNQITKEEMKNEIKSLKKLGITLLAFILLGLGSCSKNDTQLVSIVGDWKWNLQPEPSGIFTELNLRGDSTYNGYIMENYYISGKWTSNNQSLQLMDSSTNFYNVWIINRLDQHTLQISQDITSIKYNNITYIR